MLAELALFSAAVYSLARFLSVAELCFVIKVICCSIELIESFSDLVCALIKPVMLVPVTELEADFPVALAAMLLRLV
ncbi:hypothetical protein Aam_034_134 [Acidocella aminolytica 101 = DSM 11237]|uniref:Uncharacterized protein n=1 Tax=Acidocella aminolytica 101 = DSM 11237 TaxID=1120923 RepID=A0A0D6PE01_9PROT|nr:hypothetical protein Aam_034_134 [Acidocella aminolytica 101 = DSM 11237]GBQ35559.1 hypothetical protein AA11237_1004 [Acidocella aminolytica 101 = DSM 11237]